jgi:hypothetical protein
LVYCFLDSSRGTVDGEEPHARRRDGAELMVQLGQTLHILEGAASPAVSSLFVRVDHSTVGLKIARGGRHPEQKDRP